MASLEEMARFDTRLPRKQKLFFEKAARLGGYRSLTDFMILSAQKRANEIFEEHKQIIASNRDSEIFFNAITNSPEPNIDLRSAANEYKENVPK